MYVLMAFLFMSSIVGYATLYSASTQPDYGSIQAETLAISEIYYANAVKTYIAANPAFSGSIPDAALNFDPWYVNLGWTNSAVPPYAYIYPASITFLGKNTQIITKLSEKTNRSYLIGSNKSGQFYNPVFGYNPAITIPAGVPNNAPMYIVKNN